MNRKLLLLAALAGLVLALLFGDWQSDRDCIRLITQEELPQARVLRSERNGDCFAIFFELPADDAEELCRRIPTRDGWHSLTPDRRFGISNDLGDDITGLSGSFALVAGKNSGSIPCLIRLEDGKTLVAVRAHICI